MHGEFSLPVLLLCSGFAVPQAPSGSFIDGRVVRLGHRFIRVLVLGWQWSLKHGVNPGSSPIGALLGLCWGYIGIMENKMETTV